MHLICEAGNENISSASDGTMHANIQTLIHSSAQFIVANPPDFQRWGETGEHVHEENMPELRIEPATYTCRK